LRLRAGSVIGLVSGILVLVSTVLPWYSYSFYDYGGSLITYSLLDLVNYGLNSPFEPAVGRALFMISAWALVLLGGLLGFASAVVMSMYEGKRAKALLAVSGMFVLLSPTVLAAGFVNAGIPLYGLVGAHPYLAVAFLSYGFYCAIIAGILMLTAFILMTVPAKQT
jgi:hypothetical protein